METERILNRSIPQKTKSAGMVNSNAQLRDLLWLAPLICATEITVPIPEMPVIHVAEYAIPIKVLSNFDN